MSTLKVRGENVDKVRELQQIQLVSVATTCFSLSLLIHRNRKALKTN